MSTFAAATALSTSSALAKETWVITLTKEKTRKELIKQINIAKHCDNIFLSYRAIIWVDSIKCSSSGGVHKFSIYKQLMRHTDCHVVHFHVKLKQKY